MEDLKPEERQELASQKWDIESHAASKPIYATALGRTSGPYPKAACTYGMLSR
ncbi:MAG: hypothetical protein ING71_11080 [Rhodocyclaceae bacterium]|jgi:hypothetical protein|nr:hypothetical protein [Rhodocyclaceae bacterium]